MKMLNRFNPNVITTRDTYILHPLNKNALGNLPHLAVVETYGAAGKGHIFSVDKLLQYTPPTLFVCDYYNNTLLSLFSLAYYNNRVLQWTSAYNIYNLTFISLNRHRPWDFTHTHPHV